MSIDKVLGKITEYPDQYDPGILVRELRQNNRDTVNLDGDNLPFVGYDVWNAYEISGLTSNGFPVAGIAKCVYPCDSKYIVESKSIKLYFNSFNMQDCGKGPAEVLQWIAEKASEDLGKLLETDVKVVIHMASIDVATEPLFSTGNVMSGDYQTLEDTVGPKIKNKVFDVYQETPELLKIKGYAHELTGTTDGVICKFHSALLKSNCKVTSQPDWGDVYVYMKSDALLQPESLLEYIISFRNECHFHEEICETLYKRLHDIFNPKELCVTCLYARRGGIDINPTRASHAHLINKRLIDPYELHTKTTKQ